MLKHLLILFASLFVLSTANAADGDDSAATPNWEAGKNYFLIEPALPVATGKKIEVLEVFSYNCSHCAHFQPYAEQLKQQLPAYASFGYMPAIFHPTWEMTARAFYTAEMLSVLDQTHQALFDALHRDHRPLQTMDNIAQFYSEYGVDPKTFLSTAASFVVEGKLARSREMVPKYGIEGTPSIIVNGKYRVTAEAAGGFPQMVTLVNWLVQKEHNTKPEIKASR